MTGKPRPGINSDGLRFADQGGLEVEGSGGCERRPGAGRWAKGRRRAGGLNIGYDFRVLEVTIDAVLDAVSTSWMNFVALQCVSLSARLFPSKRLLHSTHNSVLSCTLIFRILQRRHPALDFLWERRGGMFLPRDLSSSFLNLSAMAVSGEFGGPWLPYYRYTARLKRLSLQVVVNSRAWGNQRETG